MQIWTPVKVKTAGHPNEGQAGTVYSTNPAHPDQVAVVFDLDKVVLVVNIADLQML